MTQAEKFEQIAEKIRDMTHRTNKIIANNFAIEIGHIPSNYMDILTPLGIYFSNLDNAYEAWKVAMSYFNADANGLTTFSYVKDQGCLKGESEAQLHDSSGNDIMDDSTFVSLILRGIEYTNSPYYMETGLTCDPTIIEHDASKSWSEEYFDQQYTQFVQPFLFPENQYMDQYGSYRVLTASDIATYYDRIGLTWFADSSYPRIGDLCFFYEENTDGTLVKPDVLMGITRVGFMVDSENFLFIDENLNNGNITKVSIYDKVPFIYARPPYGAHKDGGALSLADNKTDLIPNMFAELQPGTTELSGMTLNLDGKTLTVTSDSSSQASDTSFAVISEDCPLILPMGVYRLSGTINNTGENLSDTSNFLYGIQIYSNGEDIPGTIYSADGTVETDSTGSYDLGGGCEFTIDSDNTLVNINIFLSGNVSYNGLVIEPVLYKVGDYNLD